MHCQKLRFYNLFSFFLYSLFSPLYKELLPPLTISSNNKQLHLQREREKTNTFTLPKKKKRVTKIKNTKKEMDFAHFFAHLPWITIFGLLGILYSLYINILILYSLFIIHTVFAWYSTYFIHRSVYNVPTLVSLQYSFIHHIILG